MIYIYLIGIILALALTLVGVLNGSTMTAWDRTASRWYQVLFIIAIAAAWPVFVGMWLRNSLLQAIEKLRARGKRT